MRPRPVVRSEDCLLSAVSHVQIARVAAEEPFHAVPEVRLGGLYDRMMMRIHQAARVRQPVELPADPREAPDVAEAVAVVENDRATSGSLWHDVMNCAGGFVSGRSRHVQRA